MAGSALPGIAFLRRTGFDLVELMRSAQNAAALGGFEL